MSVTEIGTDISVVISVDKIIFSKPYHKKIAYSTFNLVNVGVSQRNVCGFELQTYREWLVQISVWQCKCDILNSMSAV